MCRTGIFTIVCFTEARIDVTHIGKKKSQRGALVLVVPERSRAPVAALLPSSACAGSSARELERKCTRKPPGWCARALPSCAALCDPLGGARTSVFLRGLRHSNGSTTAKKQLDKEKGRVQGWPSPGRKYRAWCTRAKMLYLDLSRQSRSKSLALAHSGAPAS